jgi:hypothetical protein
MLRPNVTHLGRFITATLVFWGFAFTIAFHATDMVSVPGSPGAEFLAYLAGEFSVLFACYFLGAIGGSTAMHFDGGWRVLSDPDPGRIPAFSRLAIGAVAGMLSYLALTSGLLSIFVQLPNSETPEPSFVFAMFMAILSGFYAPRVFEAAGSMFGGARDGAEEASDDAPAPPPDPTRPSPVSPGSASAAAPSAEPPRPDQDPKKG